VNCVEKNVPFVMVDSNMVKKNRKLSKLTFTYAIYRSVSVLKLPAQSQISLTILGE